MASHLPNSMQLASVLPTRADFCATQCPDSRWTPGPNNTPLGTRGILCLTPPCSRPPHFCEATILPSMHSAATTVPSAPTSAHQRSPYLLLPSTVELCPSFSLKTRNFHQPKSHERCSVNLNLNNCLGEQQPQSSGAMRSAWSRQSRGQPGVDQEGVGE